MKRTIAPRCSRYCVGMLLAVILHATSTGYATNTVGIGGGFDVFETIGGAATPVTNPIPNRYDVRPNYLVVGWSGLGYYLSSSGSETIAQGAIFGDTLSGRGYLTLQGSGTFFGTEEFIVVGNSGDGNTTLTSGAELLTELMEIGSEPESFGDVSLSGASTLFASNSGGTYGQIVVGVRGIGRLGLSSGSTAYTYNAAAGLLDGASGEIIVGGSNSLFGVENLLSVGGFGDGTFDVLNEGQVTVGNQLYIGREAGGIGEVTIDGGTLSTGTSASAADPDLEIGFAGTGTFTQTSGTTNVGQQLVLANLATGHGTLNLSGGTIAAPSLSVIGNNGTGVATVSSTGVLDVSHEIIVGRYSGSSGNLSIETGGTVRSTKTFRVGAGAGSTGDVTVSGAGATLEVNLAGLDSNPIIVGDNGTGVMTVSAGGQVNAGDSIYVGSQNGATGTVMIDGTGTSLSVGDGLFVGHIGSGTADISDGAQVTVGGEVNLGTWNGGTGSLDITQGGSLNATGPVYVGFRGGGIGDLLVDGLDSTLTATGILNVGHFGNGTATISGGALVISQNVTVGHQFNGHGTLNISDAGTSVDVSGDFVVGNEALAGNATISAGAQVTVGNQLYVGVLSDGNNVLTIDGMGTNVTGSKSAYVGHTGQGVLNLTGGAHFETQGSAPNGVQIAREPNSTGEMNISGVGTTMHSAGHWYVGYQGTLGTANISDGAVVTTGSYVRVGLSEPGTGVLTIDGAGSMLSASDEVIVGDFGTGTLNITNGGQLTTTQNLVLGERGENASGTATISDNSIIDVTATTIVGKVGTGTMMVKDAAQLTIGGGLDIGQQSTGVGTYVQTGGNVDIGGDMRVSVSVGSAGSATITGGTLDAQNLSIKPFNTDLASTGELTIGGDAAISVDGSAYVGGSISGSGGNGSLTISGNADFHAADTLKVFDQGSVSLEGGSLHAATIVLEQFATFSFTGGELNVGIFSTPGIELEQQGGVLSIGDDTTTGTSRTTGYRLQAGTLEIKLDGAGDSDRLAAEGGTDVSIDGGDLSLSFLNGYVPQFGDSFTIMQGLTISGSFSTITAPDLGALSFQTSVEEINLTPEYHEDIMVLSVVATLTGDYNLDGTVDAADYTVWLDNLGQTGSALAADGNLSGVVDATDYDLWKQNFGTTLAGALSVSVPEPTSGLLLILAMASFVLWRRD